MSRAARELARRFPIYETYSSVKKIDAALRPLVEAARELLRVDDEHGSVNSEMAEARRRLRSALKGWVQP